MMGWMAGVLIFLMMFSVGWAWEPQGEVFPWGEEDGSIIGEVVDWGEGWVLLQKEDGALVSLPYDVGGVYWEGTPVGADAFSLAQEQLLYAKISLDSSRVDLYNPYRTLLLRVEREDAWARSINGGPWKRVSLGREGLALGLWAAMVKLELSGRLLVQNLSSLE
ncbi:MAG: hypothetical protein ACOYCE_05495 [Limnochordia bacterium]|nr:hypothetical protein [Bacillota bacterium]